MSFERPTLTELVARVQSDFVSRLNLSGAVLRRSVIAAFARAVAGAVHMLHGHVAFLAAQIFPDTSEDEFLVRQASVFGLSKIPPDYATATVTLTGVDASVAPAGSSLLRADGAIYTLDADATIASGTATAAVTASLAGAVGTLDAGVVLTFESPIVGVDSTATVASSVQDGSDQESTDGLRARLLARLDDPPHGGSTADYVAWAKEVPGVTRVWVTPLGLGPGTVVVRFARDNDAGPIPDSGEVAAVQAKLDEKAPAHASVTASAPADLPVAFTLHIVPDTSAIRAVVTAELNDTIKREGSPGAVLLLSSLRTTVGISAGVTNYTMTVPSADITPTVNQLPSLGTITWS